MKLAITNIVVLFLLSNVYGQTWTIEQCVDSAIANNTSIAIAQKNKEISQLKHKEARANLLPKLSVNGDYKYFIELPYQLMPLSIFGGPEGQFKEAQFGVPHNINANLILQVPIYSPNLLGNIEKVKTTQKIIDVEVQKIYEQVYFEIITIYRNAQLVKNQIDFIDTTIKNTTKILDNIKLLVSEKLAKQSDVRKLKLKISTLNLYNSNLETKLQQLYNGLQLLTGSTVEFEVENNIEMTVFEKYKPNGNKDFDIIQLQKELISIDLKTLKKTKYTPEIGLVATYGTQGLGYDKKPHQFFNFYPLGYVGIRVSYSLFNGTVTNKKINQKELELENIKLKESLVTDVQNIEIENATLKLNNASKNIDLSESQVKLAQIIYEQEISKHKAGLAAINDVFIAQNDIIQHQQNHLQNIAEYLAADLELKKLTNNILNN
jgi:outer membrane protein TolC